MHTVNRWACFPLVDDQRPPQEGTGHGMDPTRHKDRWRLPEGRAPPWAQLRVRRVPPGVSETVSSRPRSRAAPLAPVEPVGIIGWRRGPVVNLHHPNAHQVSQRRQLRTYELVLAEV